MGGGVHLLCQESVILVYSSLLSLWHVVLGCLKIEDGFWSEVSFSCPPPDSCFQPGYMAINARTTTWYHVHLPTGLWENTREEQSPDSSTHSRTHIWKCKINLIYFYMELRILQRPLIFVIYLLVMPPCEVEALEWLITWSPRCLVIDLSDGDQTIADKSHPPHPHPTHTPI